MNDPVWLLSGRKDAIQREAFHRLAKLVAIAILIGLCIAPFLT